MNKKEYILILLDKLSSIREIALPLKNLVENTNIDDEFINGLASMLMESVHEITDESNQEKMRISQEFLKKLQQKEIDEKINIDDELDTILASL